MGRGATRAITKCMGFFLLSVLLLTGSLEIWLIFCGEPPEFIGQKLREALPSIKATSKLTVLQGALAILLETNNTYELQLPGEWTQDTYCDIFQHDGLMKRATVPNVWDSYLHLNPSDVAFVSHATFDRLDVVYRMVHHWSGPVSLSLYVHFNDTNVVYHLYDTYPLLFARDNINIHLVLAKGYIYPSGYLRNLALTNARTEYVFLSDTDVICSPGMHQQLLTHIEDEHLLSPDRKEVLAIPSFETKLSDLPFPQNKTELLNVWEQNQVDAFYSVASKRSFLPVNFTKWKTADESYKVPYSWFFEPFVVMRRDQAPEFDTRMLGRNFDKVYYYYRLNYTGFEFIVLPDLFSIHYPHKPATSFEPMTYLPDKEYHTCSKFLNDAILQEIREEASAKLKQQN